jgi:signal transduction histidine kinase
MMGTGAGTTGLSLVNAYDGSSSEMIGTVSDSGLQDRSCGLMDSYCPLLEKLYEKEQGVVELTTRLDEAETTIKHLDGLAKLGELSAIVAHEIRNPLAGISATAEVLLEDLDFDDPRHESVSIILEEIQRLEKTVRNLLDFARQRKPYVTRVDVRDQMERALTTIDALVREQDVEVCGTCPNELPDAKADPELVQQALVNIAMNAVQAMPDGGELKVRLFEDADERGPRVNISVSDSGSGINDADMARIFDPFFTTKASGAGLGLAVSRKVIEAQGGAISVKSRVGRGTTFTVSLPAAARRAPLPTARR